MSRFGRSSARASLLALALLSFATSCAGASGWRAAEHKLREQGLLHDVSPGAVTFRADAPGDDAPPPDPLPPAEAKVRAAREILEDPDRRARRRAHRAVRMLREALELDATKREALALLGRAHQLGEGAEMDERLAVSYFERAAELGDPDAHEELALAYSLGWVRLSSRTSRDARGAGQVRAALAEAGASTQPLRRGGRRRWIRDQSSLRKYYHLCERASGFPSGLFW